MKAVINFYLTWKCNFSCDHCIHECGPSGNHMTLEQMEYGFNLIKWLYEHDVPVVVIGTTGGEATLHPQFWTEYAPRLLALKKSNNISLELHTNATSSIGETEKILYNKLFNTIFVGHDMCHRQFAPLNALQLQDYTDIGASINLHQNDYIIGAMHHTIYLRFKGRTVQSLTNGRLHQLSVNGYPKLGCTWDGKQIESDCLHFVFTPDYVNHCGEKRRPLPPLPDQSKIDEGQFHSYGMDYEKLFHAASEYGIKYSGKNCSQKCMANFYSLIPIPSPEPS